MSTGGAGRNLGSPFGVGWARVIPGLPGPPGPPGDRGEPGPPGADGRDGADGAPAVTDFYSTELPFAGDVTIRSTITGVLTMALPAGRFMVSGTVALTNQSASAYSVDLWLSPSLNTPLAFGGPRAAQVQLAAGAAESVTIGPVVILVGPDGLTFQLVAQRSAGPIEDVVLATEGTAMLNRAGATGMTALGQAS